MMFKHLSRIRKVVLMTITLSLISTTSINASAANHTHTSECKQIQTLEKHRHTGSTGECYGDCGTFLFYRFSSNEYGHGADWKCDVCGVTKTEGHPFSPDGSECDHTYDHTVCVNKLGGGTIFIEECFDLDNKNHRTLKCAKSTSKYYDEFGNEYSSSMCEVPICSKIVYSISLKR